MLCKKEMLIIYLIAIAAEVFALPRSAGTLPPPTPAMKPNHCRTDLPGCVPKEIKYIFMLHIPKVYVYLAIFALVWVI